MSDNILDLQERRKRRAAKPAEEDLGEHLAEVHLYERPDGGIAIASAGPYQDRGLQGKLRLMEALFEASLELAAAIKDDLEAKDIDPRDTAISPYVACVALRYDGGIVPMTTHDIDPQDADWFRDSMMIAGQVLHKAAKESDSET